MDRGAWWAIDHGVTELDTTEHVRAHTHTHTRPCSPPPALSLSWLSPPGGPPPSLHQVSTGPHCPLAGLWAAIAALSSVAPSSWGDPAPRPGQDCKPQGTILAAALLFLLAKRVGVQQAFAGERRQKIKLLKLHSCRQIERPPNSSELPNLDPSAHLPPQEVVG